MELRVLGTIEIGDDPDRAPLHGRLQRLLLALLARRAAVWTSVDTLLDALWPHEPGAGAEARLHVHVHRLRGRLGAEAIEQGPSGYRLTLLHSAVDAWELDELVSEALAGHYELDEDGALLATLERGLALWRGVPFADVEHPLLAAERHRLTEMYLLGQETRFQRRLDRGEHEHILEAISDLGRQFPLRERLQALWMTALYRAGEQGSALQVYQRARGRLVEELGIEPGSELRGVHELVLADAPSGPAARAGANETPAPRQIPAPSGPLVGRAPQLQALDRALRSSPHRSGTRLVLLTGPGGIGKSELVCTWATRQQHRYPGGQLYARLGEGAPATSATELLEYLLISLGMPPHQVAATVAERTAQLRSLLGQRHTLVVLDDATTLEQVRTLLSPHGTTDVIAICRVPPPGLEEVTGAVHVALPPLDTQAARRLLRRRLGTGTTLPDHELDEVADRCGRRPFSIVVAAEKLRRSHRVGSGEPIGAAYDDLDGDAQLLLRRLSLLPSGAIDVPVAAAAAALDVGRAGRALERLVRDRLVSIGDGGRYRMHDEVRAVAGQRAMAADRPHEQERAATRALEHILATEPWSDGQPPCGNSRTWMLDDGATTVEMAIGLGSAGAAHRGRLADELAPSLVREGRYTTAERLLRAALADRPDAATDARWRRRLGLVLSTLGRQGDALGMQAQAEVHVRRTGDRVAHVGLLLEMVVVAAVTGDLHRSIRLLDEASEVTRAAGGSEIPVQIVRALVLVLMHRNEHAGAVLSALGPDPEIEPERRVTWLRARSQLHRRRGEHGPAIRFGEEAISLAERIGSHHQIGLATVDLASCLRDAGERAAVERYQEALRHAHGAGRDPLAAMTHAALTAAWLRWDDPGRATAHGREALRIAERCESWGFAARAGVRLGDAADALGEPMRAAWYRRLGLAYYRRVDYPLSGTERDRLELLLG